MDTISVPFLTANAATQANAVRANELLSTFNQYAAQIKVLSLDCFDTLLWRNVAEPTDVFFNLAERPIFKKLKLSKAMRMTAESLSYKLNAIKCNATQATLKEIYQICFPNASQELIDQYVEEELALEMESCYVFPPIIALIRAAAAKNIKVIIVSDTYFEKSQLTRLLKSKLPADLFPALSDIFCSCDYGKAKAAGLFHSVLQKIRVAPQAILHIGDNPTADSAAPLQHNMHAIQLLHHEESVHELLRMRAVAASLFDPSIRVSRPLCSLFHALFAMQLNQVTPENLIGYVTAGPIFYAFSRFILEKIAKIKQTGKQPKVLFLMRDGYLPSLVCETVAGQAVGTRIRISRFVSYAASFRKKDDVERYLAQNVQSLRFESLCRQLLLPEKMSAPIVKRISEKNNAIAEFCQWVLQESVLTTIFVASTAYRKRLIHYLEKEIDLKPDDTLLFVDLGYTGTTQNKLSPILKEEMNVDVIGCYLLSLNTHENVEMQTTRCGLFDSTVYDNNALVMLVTYIAMFEQICTSNESSVVDYNAEGQPIFSDVVLNAGQQNKLAAIQAEAIRFAQDALTFSQETGIKLESSALRDVAASHLCQFIFFLTQNAREYLESFQFELNLGTKDILQLIDVSKGLTNLRRRGWLHSLKDNDQDRRMNYPAEWRAINYNLTLGLMMEHRFDIKIALNDLSQQREKISVMITDGQQVSNLHFDALPTYDGYFSMLIPIVNAHCEVGICFGQRYQWIEIESANLIKLEHLYGYKELEHTQDASSYFAVKKMRMRGEGIFESESEEGMLIFVPKAAQIQFNKEMHILQIVFRPLKKI